MKLTYDSWNELSQNARDWGNPAYHALVTSEQRLCEHDRPEKSVARFRNVSLIPSILQTVPYIDGLCRAAQLDDTAIHSNYASCLTRQELLRKAGVRQKFLIDEVALTRWPGGFKPPVKPQLCTIVDIVRADMNHNNYIDFRVVTRDAIIPKEVYGDTFYLYETVEANSIVGFKEPWSDGPSLRRADDGEVAKLQESWQKIGQVALDRYDSLGFLMHLSRYHGQENRGR